MWAFLCDPWNFSLGKILSSLFNSEVIISDFLQIFSIIYLFFLPWTHYLDILIVLFLSSYFLTFLYSFHFLLFSFFSMRIPRSDLPVCYSYTHSIIQPICVLYCSYFVVYLMFISFFVSSLLPVLYYLYPSLLILVCLLSLFQILSPSFLIFVLLMKSLIFLFLLRYLSSSIDWLPQR